MNDQLKPEDHAWHKGQATVPDQPKPATGLRDYHDVPFPEGTQPTGEWTVEFVESMSRESLRKLHNAALADEVKKREGIEQRLGVAFDNMVHDHQRQLVAERERFMQAYRDATEAALAKMKQ